ncbi:MAG: hypothetical protein ABFR32_10530 [Bacteroidota bacterium]
MKFVIKSLILIVIGIHISFQLSSQTFIDSYDSIPILKPNKGKSLYKFDNSIINEIKLKTKKTKRSKYPAGQVFGDVGRGALTVLFGRFMDFEDSDIVTWKFRGKLICNDENYNWDINLFCDGESVKLSESVENDDGSYTLQTYEDKYFDWENEATGIIIEKKDTIGKFFIVMDPQNDSILKQRTNEIYSQEVQKYPEKEKNISNNFLEKLLEIPVSVTEFSIDYGIIGKFRDKNFAIIADGITKKTWIFEEGKLQCIFQAFMNKKSFTNNEIINPYLLLDTRISENKNPDWFRLAILSKYLSETLCKKSN